MREDDEYMREDDERTGSPLEFIPYLIRDEDDERVDRTSFLWKQESSINCTLDPHPRSGRGQACTRMTNICARMTMVTGFQQYFNYNRNRYNFLT